MTREHRLAWEHEDTRRAKAATPALSVVGHGIHTWLTHHGPATVQLLADHYAEHVLNGDEALEATRVITAELRHLETLGHVRRIRDAIDGRPSPLWAAKETA